MLTCIINYQWLRIYTLTIDYNHNLKNFQTGQMIEQNSVQKYKNRRMYKPPPKEDSSGNYKKLIIVIIISFVFITGEFVGGYISGSISVISDAFHLLTDLLGFIVSFVFLWFAKKKPNERMSFGYHRMEVNGALGNLFIIWALAIFLIYEATLRIIEKQFVKEPTVMLIVAAVGLPINIVMYFVLHAGSSHSHGLMAEPCGQEYPVDNQHQAGNICSELICEDIQCLINQEYEEHCHKKQGQSQQIHKHQVKVVVEGGEVKRKSSIDDPKDKEKHQHKNCSHNHEGEHKHAPKNDHKHDLKQSEEKSKEKHEHVHQNGKKCSHDHSKSDRKVGDKAESIENIHPDDSHHHDHSGHDHSGHEHHHEHESLSMKAAVLHALSDVIQSIGLIISALIIFFAGSDKGKPVTEWNNWHYCDPITTYIFSVIVLVSTWPVLKNCYFIIMESTPTYVQVKQMQEQFTKVDGVVDVHDLHVWDLRPGKTLLIAHVFSQTGRETEVLKKLTDISRKRRIYHSTFQVEEEELRHHEEYILCDHDIH